MKPSSYNVFVEYEPDNVHIGYNCVSGGMYIFNEKQYGLVREILREPEESKDNDKADIKTKLIKGRFLIDDNVDELKILRLRNSMARYNPNGVGLVITPTLKCNFNCPYCNVDRNRTVMSQHSVRALKNFFQKKLEKCDKAAVCWTGGEPLLALDVVEDLNSYFQGESRKKNEYECSMITNGYLLTSSCINRLKNCGIKTLQITLDGYRDYHDNMRFTIGGKKTYSRILDNVINASNNDLTIILRTNIDKKNYESIYNLVDELSKTKINKENFIFAPCMVMDTKSECSNCEENYFFSNREFSYIEPEILLYSLKKGFNIHKSLLSTLKTFCGANTLSLYVVDSDTNILRCWCNLGCTDNNKIGHINENGEVFLENYSVLSQWMAWEPFEIEECVNCKVLPMCMGGCMYYNLMGKTDKIEIGCSHRKYNLEQMLTLYYISATKEMGQLENIVLSNSLNIELLKN